MTNPDAAEQTPAFDGGRTAVGGTPVAVDVSRDHLARVTWVVFLGGPVIWFAHFMLVYLVAEAGCTGGGPGLRAFDPPVPATVTLIATALAAGGCAAFAVWGYRSNRRASQDHEAADDPGGLSGSHPDRDRGGTLTFAGFLLSLFSLVAVLFVGLPAVVLQC